MVVDDSLTVRKITGRLLERAGYHVLTAKDGVEALEQLGQLGQEIPAVMLVDIEMPHMDGFELVRALCADPHLTALPVIMITSRSAAKASPSRHRTRRAALSRQALRRNELLTLIAGLQPRLPPSGSHAIGSTTGCLATHKKTAC
jgi:chemosensory pili system protein ChpA (sensor histidine kinase/response regulator)